MSTPVCLREVEQIEALRKLNNKFHTNAEEAFGNCTELSNRVEHRTRKIIEIGTLLREMAHNDTQAKICDIYDEVFADCVCAIILAAQGLDRPAELVLRRVLELGLTTVYLWDQPQLFWGWEKFDLDLSFKEIVDYLSSDSYMAFVSVENKEAVACMPIDATLCRKEYRHLSNIIHGKITTFETVLDDRFRYVEEDWRGFLLRTERIQDILVSAICSRYPKFKSFLHLECSVNH